MEAATTTTTTMQETFFFKSVVLQEFISLFAITENCAGESVHIRRVGGSWRCGVCMDLLSKHRKISVW
ncbi:hypothetical protein WN943_009633 [Citrus x changshan-huyou]